jgi:hypothetical protein
MATYGPRELAEEVGAVTGLGAEKTRRLWSAVGRLADGTLAAGKGLSIPGLGRWTYLRTSNVHEEFGIRKPIFTADPQFLRINGLAPNEPPRSQLVAPCAALNCFAAAANAGLSKDEAKATVAAVARYVGAAAALGRKVRLPIGQIGELRCDSRVVRFVYGARAPQPTQVSKAPIEVAPSTARLSTGRSDHLSTVRSARSTARSQPATARSQPPATARSTARSRAAATARSALASSRLSARQKGSYEDLTPGRKPEPRQVLGILDQLLAPMGRDDAIKPLLKTARRQNVAQQYDAYERALQNAHKKTEYEEREMVRVRDEDRRRQAARMAAHHTLELENAQNVLLQADEARARKALDKVSEPWTMAEATKAFPFLNYVPDHIGKRKKAEGYGAELEKQVRSAEEHQRKAKAHERAADARALATSMALVARDREARRLIHEAAHGELAADWRRSMDLTELKKGVTKNGSLIQGH